VRSSVRRSAAEGRRAAQALQHHGRRRHAERSGRGVLEHAEWVASGVLEKVDKQLQKCMTQLQQCKTVLQGLEGKLVVRPGAGDFVLSEHQGRPQCPDE